MENAGKDKELGFQFSPFPLDGPFCSPSSSSSSSFSSLAAFAPSTGWTTPPPPVSLPSGYAFPGMPTSTATGGRWSDSTSSAAAATPVGVSQGFRLVGGKRDQGTELGDTSDVQVWSYSLPSMLSQSGLPYDHHPIACSHHHQSNGTDPFPMTSAILDGRHKELEDTTSKHEVSTRNDCLNQGCDRRVQTSSPTRRRSSLHQVHMSTSTRLSFLACGVDASFQGSLMPNAMGQSQASCENFHAIWPSQVWINPSSDETDLEKRGLVLLVQKELRKSDVSRLGRIVLPKRDAEENLPSLVEKEGVMMQMEDLSFPVLWTFKYRYWPNNKSRMYIMENTGDFIRMHGLQVGDLFIIYSGYEPGNYTVRGRKRRCPSSCATSFQRQ